MRGFLIHLPMSDDAALQPLYTKDDNMYCKQTFQLHQQIDIVVSLFALIFSRAHVSLLFVQ